MCRDLECFLDALPALGGGLDKWDTAGIQRLVEIGERRGIREVAFVVLNDQRNVVGVELVRDQVFAQILHRVRIRVDHGVLRVGNEHDAVGALQNHSPGRVVEHLAGDRVELHAGLHPANRAELDRKKVEEERAIRFGGEREHLALVLDGQLLVDPLQVGRLAAQTRTVVDDLRGEFFCGVVEENHL